MTWQFTEDKDGARDYYWGHYAANKDSAVRDFEARVSEYQKDYGVSERTAHSTPPKRIAEQLAEAEKQVARGIDAPAKKQNKSHEDR